MTSVLIAVEGIDGAGKQTLVAALVERLESSGGTCEQTAFPRYERAPFGPLITAGLQGEDQRLLDSVTAMSLGYAVDRWQWWHHDRTARRATDHVVVDRWCASNAAYGSGRVTAGLNESDAAAEAADFRGWVEALEFDRLTLPRPDLTVLLATDDELAGERRADRTGSDVYEADGGLQTRALTSYRAMAAEGWGGRWFVLDPLDEHGGRRRPFELAAAVLDRLDGA